MNKDNGYLDYRLLKSKLYDELGNLKKAYEIARYEKSNGEWVEIKRYNTIGKSNFVIDGKIYFRVDNTLIPMNMDFNSSSCGACEKVISEIEVGHKITGNEVLYECSIGTDRFKLCKQSYSDTTCFYTLKDSYGNWKNGYGSKDIKDIIETIEYELESIKEAKNKSYNQNVEIQAIFDGMSQSKEKLLQYMRKVA